MLFELLFGNYILIQQNILAVGEMTNNSCNIFSQTSFSNLHTEKKPRHFPKGNVSVINFKLSFIP
jgi:hypothetical protein